VNEHRNERPFVHGAVLEIVEVTLDELRNQPAWNRYSLTWLEPQLGRIARTGDLDEQRALFREVEAIAREHGHARVIDGWEPDVAWLRGAQ
jgi:hypothetical protein